MGQLSPKSRSAAGRDCERSELLARVPRSCPPPAIHPSIRPTPTTHQWTNGTLQVNGYTLVMSQCGIRDCSTEVQGRLTLEERGWGVWDPKSIYKPKMAQSAFPNSNTRLLWSGGGGALLLWLSAGRGPSWSRGPEQAPHVVSTTSHFQVCSFESGRTAVPATLPPPGYHGCLACLALWRSFNLRSGAMSRACVAQLVRQHTKHRAFLHWRCSVP